MKRVPKSLLVVAALSAAAAVPPALATVGDTTRISIHDDDTTQPNQAALASAVSADGRYVAFVTNSQLTATPVPGNRAELHVRDRQTGTTVLASSSAAGEAANNDVEAESVGNMLFAISGDGRYVVFESKATNLLTPDANADGADVYRKDLQTGAIIRVNVTTVGAQSSAVDGDPDISYDGNRVAFNTGQANLFATDVSISSDIALRDIAAGTTTLVSQDTAGQQSNGFTERPSISADGRHVTFTAVADATNLFPNDTNALNDVLVRDTVASTTSVASVSTLGTTPGNANFSDISGDGRYVVFEAGTDFDPANAFAGNNVYRRDLVANTTLLVSSRNAVAQGGNQGGIHSALSADGTRVAFKSASTDLIATDANAADDVYVRDTVASTTTRASSRTGDAEGANASTHAAIAGSGGLVAFTYDDNPGASPMVAGDTNALSDVFAKELTPSDTTGPAITVSAPAAGAKTEATQIAVTGTVAADPSGNVETTVAGAKVTLGVNGAFSHTVPLNLGVNAVPVTARDGSGNLSTTPLSVERVAPAAVTPQPQPQPTKPKAARITQLKVVTARRKITARFQLTRPGTVRVELRRLPKLKAVRKPLSRSLRVGRNTIVMPIPRLGRGKYRLIFTVKSDGGTTKITRTFAVR